MAAQRLLNFPPLVPSCRRLPRHWSRDVLLRLKQLLVQSEKKYHTFLMGKINPAKLSNFTEIDIYTIVACPETSLVRPCWVLFYRVLGRTVLSTSRLCCHFSVHHCPPTQRSTRASFTALSSLHLRWKWHAPWSGPGLDATRRTFSVSCRCGPGALDAPFSSSLTHTHSLSHAKLPRRTWMLI